MCYIISLRLSVVSCIWLHYDLPHLKQIEQCVSYYKVFRSICGNIVFVVYFSYFFLTPLFQPLLFLPASCKEFPYSAHRGRYHLRSDNQNHPPSFIKISETWFLCLMIMMNSFVACTQKVCQGFSLNLKKNIFKNH